MAADLVLLSETVIDLEVRLAYQDKVIAELDQVIQLLFVRLEKVEQELREVREGAAPVIGPAAEPPPHY